MGSTATLPAGDYFLALTTFNVDPVSPGGLFIFPNAPFQNVFGPTGPGGGAPISGWANPGFTPGTYTINLTGAAFSTPEPGTLALFGLFTLLFFQYFAYILPVGALFLAGFLAPRASYLAGFIVGAAATVVLAVTLASGILGDELDAEGMGSSIVLNGLITSTIGGMLVSSAAAWYKRFLNLANPNRGRRPPPRKTAPRRR